MASEVLLLLTNDVDVNFSLVFRFYNGKTGYILALRKKPSSKELSNTAMRECSDTVPICIMFEQTFQTF